LAGLVRGTAPERPLSVPGIQRQKDNIVGTLFVKDVLKLAEQGGRVKDVIKRDVCYVHEDFSLGQVWQTFIKTKHNLFIVVNSFEEFVGIITIEDVIAQVIGRPLIDELINMMITDRRSA